MSFFERNHYQQELQYSRAGLKAFNMSLQSARGVKYEKPVTCVDRFQSFADFQNDVKGLLIKPIACLYLSRVAFEGFIKELFYTMIHLITLSPVESLNHCLEAMEQFASFFYNQYCAIAELVINALSLPLRILITSGWAMGQTVAGAGHLINKAGGAIASCFGGVTQESEKDPNPDEQVSYAAC